MTAGEIDDWVRARKSAYEKGLADLYKANEILAFNIGALVLTAVNAPSKFPKSPEEAFISRGKRDWKAEKADFRVIAQRHNEKYKNRERENK